MTRFSSLRARLVGTVFLAIAPAWGLMFFFARKAGAQAELPSIFLAGGVGLLALAAAWYGGERFVLRQLRLLSDAARRLANGDLSTRAHLSQTGDELADLAQTFDQMAASLEQRSKERELAEKTLVTRSLQQTVVSALGQFALVSNDFAALLNQAVMLVNQTLGVEYCCVLELLPERKAMLLRAGIGWKEGLIGRATVSAEPNTQLGYTLSAGEPVVVEQLASETRFRAATLLLGHGVVSGVTVAIAGQGQAFGVLGAHTTNTRRFNEDEVHFLMAVATVLAMAAARKRAEAQLEKLASFAQLNPNPAMELAAEGSLTYFNAAAADLASSMGHKEPKHLLPANIASITRTCLASPKGKITLETQCGARTLSWSFHPVPASKVVHAYVEDITDRLSLEAQLRQSQKMESVGQLAAGVAHDFNNMLTIIQGHSGMLLAKCAQSPGLNQAREGAGASVADSAQAIYFAAERAANLTRQLLLFSRKSVMQPKQVDLRKVVLHLSKMLQRLLGETIRLEFHPPSELPLVQADVGMIEQVLMNLAVNARDAMPKGGVLTINTVALQIDSGYLQNHPEARIGSFVRLRVTDTGCGMDATTLARIFEPFFTTKEVGKGTGLGLATVYGIVKQHEGWIEVTSLPGLGTTFSIFLPASTAPVETRASGTQTELQPRGGRETVLVVEDEPVLRDLARVMLQESGYTVLEASSGRDALHLWDLHQNEIDLVLTDMVMPEGVSGMDLAQRLVAAKPSLRVILASGYSMDDIDTGFVRQGHAVFLQKPYDHLSLGKAVRECLDAN